MAQKKKEKVEKPKRKVKEIIDDSDGTSYLKKETLNAILAVVFFVIAVFLLLSAGPLDKGGPAGRGAYSIFNYLFGIGYYLLPILLLMMCVSFFQSLQKKSDGDMALVDFCFLFRPWPWSTSPYPVKVE